jgi:hypothetical protein
MAPQQPQPIDRAVLAKGYRQRVQVDRPVGVGHLERCHLRDQGVTDQHRQNEVVRTPRHAADPAPTDPERLGQTIGRLGPGLDGLSGQHPHLQQVRVTHDADPN